MRWSVIVWRRFIRRFLAFEKRAPGLPLVTLVLAGGSDRQSAAIVFLCNRRGFLLGAWSFGGFRQVRVLSQRGDKEPQPFMSGSGPKSSSTASAGWARRYIDGSAVWPIGRGQGRTDRYRATQPPDESAPLDADAQVNWWPQP